METNVKNLDLQIEMVEYVMNEEEESMCMTTGTDILFLVDDPIFLGLKLWHSCCCVYMDLR